MDPEVRRIISSATAGEAQAAEELLRVLYRELRALAASRLARERGGAKHDATSLVHEAYIRLLGDGSGRPWDNRGHFFASAAEAMRRILIDDARKRRRPKHGGDRQRLDLDRDCIAAATASEDVLALDEALNRLAAVDSDKALLVKLRYFAGLTLEEAAGVMGVSVATAKRRWVFAKAFLYSELAEND